MVSLPQVSPPKPCISLSSPPYTLHAPAISFFSILSPEQYWVSTDHSAPHYTLYVNAVCNDSVMDARLIPVGLGPATTTNELFYVGRSQLVREELQACLRFTSEKCLQVSNHNTSTARTFQVVSGSFNTHRLPHFLDEDQIKQQQQ